MPSSSHRSDTSRPQDDLELEALASQLALRPSVEDLAPLIEGPACGQSLWSSNALWDLEDRVGEEPEPLPSDLCAYAVWGGPDTVDIVGVHVGGRAARDSILQVIGAFRQ